MLAYQQQHQQAGAVAQASGRGVSTVSVVPPATPNAANSRLRFGNTNIASWTLGSAGNGDSSYHTSPRSYGGGNTYQLHKADNDAQQPLPRSQEGSHGSHRFAKPVFTTPQWQRSANHQQPQRQDPAEFNRSGRINTRPLRRMPNTSDISKQWRASPLPKGTTNSSRASSSVALAVDTAKTQFLSSTFQEKDSPLSGLSLALNKHKNLGHLDGNSGHAKSNTPLYSVPQPRTPHPLSPADSMKTPGYVDPESLPFELGTIVTDTKTGKHYKLLSVLGEGSYAVVYMARCSDDGAKYAIKCLSKLEIEPRQLYLQRTELEIHESVCPHPHIVTLYSHFETRDWLFLVMEHVAGPDLYDYITQHPAFNANQEERRFAEATRLFEQMIDAVAHIHALKAYHRDLKPENFILGADGNLKLADFGLATHESLSIDYECGSKPYMSYENRNAKLYKNDPTIYGPRDDYSPRLSDVWALGVLFLNLLFAQSPWNDPSREHCFKFCRFLREGAGFLVNQFPKLPREVADFLVTRVFSPESGRCSVLELKQWVQDLGFPFNRNKSNVAVAPRPAPPRHNKVVANIVRKPAGSSTGAFATSPAQVPTGSHGAQSHISGSFAKKWLPGQGTPGGAFKVPHHASQPATAATALVLDPAVASTGTQPKSPIDWRAPAPMPLKMPLGNTAVHVCKPNNLSTSVPALVFSQFIPATQAAAARKMMPREFNHTAAKAAAAVLQASILGLPKNGLGQGKTDSGPINMEAETVADKNDGTSWTQLESLSEESDEADTGARALEHSAAAADLASKFPRQPIVGLRGYSLGMFDSEDDMDFSEPLSFDDSHKPRRQLEATGAKSMPCAVPEMLTNTRVPPLPISAGTAGSTVGGSYSDDMDIAGSFSDEESGSTNGRGAPRPAAATAPSLRYEPRTALPPNHRVHFGGVSQSVVPLSRGGRATMTNNNNSTDSSLTATLVSPSVEYYSTRAKPVGKVAATSTSAGSTAVGDCGYDVDADDEGESSSQRVQKGRPGSYSRGAIKFAVGAALRGVRFDTRSKNGAVAAPIALHSMPAPIGALGHRGAALDTTAFSWADDVEELPIPSMNASAVSLERRAATGCRYSEEDEDYSSSDGLPWPTASDQEDMFAMEL
ncbi:hypothetical protein H4R24_002015 [Coemansia sp. RSA 988]|nr:hypothetical protein H4R24_002015 [Coemansia sp. RSA 988]